MEGRENQREQVEGLFWAFRGHVEAGATGGRGARWGKEPVVVWLDVASYSLV
ncbi:hypothetical protein GJR96_04005 [Haloferax sp. MBLA0076]|uniref:Uncharacterized protein n=1 Tax=Haloferax litoreum TaxID=2666140 RepID=A0A6A8GH95_9EURY|nr:MULTISPECIES: hypothetical protein [Haloferax]MRX21120.1 hypothetical protein [Haloferax litoreum]